jgi:hypothetical protein
MAADRVSSTRLLLAHFEGPIRDTTIMSAMGWHSEERLVGDQALSRLKSLRIPEEFDSSAVVGWTRDVNPRQPLGAGTLISIWV